MSFTFIHFAIIFLFFLIDFRYAAYYALISYIMWLSLTYPRYSGKSNIIKLKNEEEFIDFIAPISPTKSGKSKKNYSEMNSSFIIFGANWCDN
mmetsp:Transcript_34027/g.33576  ORF Transcript_34027/g.33576 Transcript_34027/m.33576 type:complete len:93 (+) Transcript_34027:59-337(+)